MKLVQDEKHTQSAFILLGCMILALILLCCSGCDRSVREKHAQVEVEQQAQLESVVLRQQQLDEKIIEMRRGINECAANIAIICEDFGKTISKYKKKSLISEEEKKNSIYKALEEIEKK